MKLPIHKREPIFGARLRTREKPYDPCAAIRQIFWPIASRIDLIVTIGAGLAFEQRELLDDLRNVGQSDSVAGQVRQGVKVEPRLVEIGGPMRKTVSIAFRHHEANRIAVAHNFGHASLPADGRDLGKSYRCVERWSLEKGLINNDQVTFSMAPAGSEPIAVYATDS